jgi:hypothetical protein
VLAAKSLAFGRHESRANVCFGFKTKKPRNSGLHQYGVTTMRIALPAPFGVCMPPPQLIDLFFHCTANMAVKWDFAKFFYLN